MADSHSANEVPSVLNEIQSGEGLSLSAAGRLFPAHRGTGSVDSSTVYRWLTKGTRGTNGQVVKLEAVRVGYRWLTSRGSVARFVAALTAATVRDNTPEVSTPRSPSAKNRAADAAGRALERRGS